MTRRTRWAVIGLVVALFLPTTLALGWRMFAGKSGRAHLYRVQAELDAEDPGWRLDDMMAARDAKLPPDDLNPITVTETAKGLLPKTYTDWQNDNFDWLPKPESNRRPRPEAELRARAAHTAAAAAIDQARKLHELKRPGGVRLKITPDVISTLLPHVQNVRESAGLLQLDAVLAALDDDPDRAVASVHAALYAGRAIGDEPFLISTLVRIACSAVARDAMERTLGLGEPAAGLAEVQAEFAAEADAPLLVIGFRGERAAMSKLFDNIDNGTVNLSIVAAIAGPGGLPGPLDQVRLWRYKSHLPADHAELLETFNKYVEISKKPVHERLALYKQVPLPPDDTAHVLSRLLIPACTKVAEADIRAKAELRAAVAGIACERFRRANGRWPNDLAEIPKNILPEVPLDAYDGKPIRYRRVADGVVVYSVGPDGQDDGGAVTREYKKKPGEDYGFRLWDPKHRRAEPLPPDPAGDP